MEFERNDAVDVIEVGKKVFLSTEIVMWYFYFQVFNGGPKCESVSFLQSVVTSHEISGIYNARP